MRCDNGAYTALKAVMITLLVVWLVGPWLVVRVRAPIRGVDVVFTLQDRGCAAAVFGAALAAAAPARSRGIAGILVRFSVALSLYFARASDDGCGGAESYRSGAFYFES